MDSAYSVPSDVLFDIHCKRQILIHSLSLGSRRLSAWPSQAPARLLALIGSLGTNRRANSTQSPYRVFRQFWQSWIAHDWFGAEPSP